MNIYTDPTTGQTVSVAVGSLSRGVARPVEVAASTRGMRSAFWVSPAEAFAIAAVALGVDERQLSDRALRLDPMSSRLKWDVEVLYVLIGDHLTAIEDRNTTLEALLADEAEATAVERS